MQINSIKRGSTILVVLILLLLSAISVFASDVKKTQLHTHSINSLACEAGLCKLNSRH